MIKFSFSQKEKDQESVLTSPLVFFQRVRPPKYFLSLDIGSEAVKALIFSLREEKLDKKITIFGNSLYYFDTCFNHELSQWIDSRNFKGDLIKKTILKAIEEAQKKSGQKPDQTLLGLPADILKGRVVFQSFGRINPEAIIDKEEKERIYQKIFKEAQTKISEIFAEESGILPKDIYFINLKILEIKIDGYQVSDLQGYNGKNLDFRILAIFLPKYYLRNIENTIKAIGLKNIRIIHQAQGLLPYLNEEPNGVFLDVGGEITQIFLAKAGKLEQINEFKSGGRAFSEAISQTLGLNIERARILKEDYSKRLLSEGVRKRIKEIFSQPLEDWLKNLKEKLKLQKTLIPATFFLFGGGSQLPEIEEILEEGNWEGLPFNFPPEVKFIYPKDFKNIVDITKSLNSPKNIGPILLCCYEQSS